MDSSVPYTLETLVYPKLKNFELFNFLIDSTILKDNPLGDSPLRNNPLLSPRSSTSKDLGVVFILSGFAGNGTKYLGDKGFEETFLQQLDVLFGLGKAPLAHYVFVDAWTFWGGSQFVNSQATGNYEDYIVKELYPSICDHLKVNRHHIAIMGQSSGGYGSLHLASAYPTLFPYCGALAPDCFFEASLLPDLYKAAPFLNLNKNYPKLKELHQTRTILKQRQGFSIINAIAMTACYSPSIQKPHLDWPINFQDGSLIAKVWNRWKQKDPVVFLKKRKLKIKKLRGLFLDVGSRDEFHLHLGVRQIHQWLKASKINHHFSEFDGGHFEAHDRYPLYWEWLQKKWGQRP